MRSKNHSPSVNRRCNSGRITLALFDVAIRYAFPRPTALITAIEWRNCPSDSPTYLLSIPERSSAIVGTPASMPNAFASALLPPPATPTATSPRHSLFSISVRSVRSWSSRTPLVSCSIFASTLSTSSRKTTTPIGVRACMRRCKCILIASRPTRSANRSVPRQTLRPGACSIMARLRSHSAPRSRPVSRSDIDTTCSAANDDSPLTASTAFASVSASGLSNGGFADACSSVTIVASASGPGSGSSNATTSWSSSGGSTKCGPSNTSIRKFCLNASRRFATACTAPAIATGSWLWSCRCAL